MMGNNSLKKTQGEVSQYQITLSLIHTIHYSYYSLYSRKEQTLVTCLLHYDICNLLEQNTSYFYNENTLTILSL